jgi:hypothetical protein
MVSFEADIIFFGSIFICSGVVETNVSSIGSKHYIICKEIIFSIGSNVDTNEYMLRFVSNNLARQQKEKIRSNIKLH